VGLAGNARVADAFARAGVNLTGAAGSGATLNVARGRTASASFTTATPAAQATSPANAVDGFTTSAPPVTSGGFVGTNPIWGDVGSPNTQDWLQVDLGTPTRVNNLKIYYYSNKAFGVGGNTYREPAAYRVQFLSGMTWVDVPGATASPGTAAPNLNQVSFTATTARQFRVLMTRQTGFAVGVKELQLFDIEPVQAQLDSIRSFVAAEPIDGAARNSLTARLPDIAAPYRAGRLDQAAAAAGTLIGQISDLATTGRLTEDQAATLTAAATAVAEHIRE
jgi:hypothetical protein